MSPFGCCKSTHEFGLPAPGLVKSIVSNEIKYTVVDQDIPCPSMASPPLVSTCSCMRARVHIHTPTHSPQTYAQAVYDITVLFYPLWCHIRN